MRLTQGPNAASPEEAAKIQFGRQFLINHAVALGGNQFLGRYTTLDALDNWMRNEIYLYSAGIRTPEEYGAAKDHWATVFGAIFNEFPLGQQAALDRIAPWEVPWIERIGPIAYDAYSAEVAAPE